MKFILCSVKGVSTLVRMAAVSAAVALLFIVSAAGASGQVTNSNVRDPGMEPLVAQAEISPCIAARGAAGALHT